LSTIDIRGLLHSRIERGCLLVWDYRRAGFPIEKNEWATWKPSLWPAWLDVARNVSNFSPKTTHQQDRFFFDCEYVVDETSFFCALGETMQGPGGYYGKDLDSMEDCLCGGFGPVPPFEIKLRSLRTSVANSAFYEEAVSILEENGVSVAADRN
jgi:RNAse (barnase) inhibitor barstar